MTTFESTASSGTSVLTVQVNNVDSYQQSPSWLDRGVYRDARREVPLPQVPIVRVFGTTKTGHNVLVHVHGVFPYCYVEYTGSIDQDDVDDYIVSLFDGINRAMNLAYRRDLANPRNIYVASIVLCKAVPFYGFHVGWRPFLKIYLVNPSYMTKCADLLRSGEILGASMQPYESHIPLPLQFFADFNLAGCSWMRVSDAYYREAAAEFEVPRNRILDPTLFNRMSYCELEVDISAGFIKNRDELPQHNLHYDFKAEHALNLEHNYKHINSMRELWREDNIRRHSHGMPSYTPPQSVERNTDNPHVWRQLEQLREHLSTRIHKASGDKVRPLEEFVPKLKHDLPTAFDTVDAMFHQTRLARPAPLTGPKLTPSTAKVDLGTTEGTESTDDDEDSIDREISLMASPAKRQGSLKQPVMTPSPKRAKRLASDTFSQLSYFSPAFDLATKRLSFQLLSTSQEGTSLSSHGMTVLDKVVRVFGISSDVLGLRAAPPRWSELLNHPASADVPPIVHQGPYYGLESDVPSIPFSHAGTEFRLKSRNVSNLRDFELLNPVYTKEMDYEASVTSLGYTLAPPTRAEVTSWLSSEEKGVDDTKGRVSATQWIPAQFRYASQGTQQTKKVTAMDREMSLLAIEVHVNNRADKLPNPDQDPVTAIFWRFIDASKDLDEHYTHGIIAVGDGTFTRCLDSTTEGVIQVLATEAEAIDCLIRMVRYHDPDVLAGYEIHASSWGYIVERARISLELDLCQELSRVRSNSNGTTSDKWGYTHASAIRVTGRHMLNIWRSIRGSLDLLQYTIENVVFQVLHERIPHYSHDDLTSWFVAGNPRELSLAAKYYVDRVNYDLRLIDSQELITRNSEQARILGIDFYSVISRGSQYKVESLLVRLTKKENFLMISPSKKQVGQQNALEHIPLVMEPLSGFYTDPIVVLDFQSLYPSIMIAYNYCYSTCLGRVMSWRGRNKLGVVDLATDPAMLAGLREHINIAPNGLIFVKDSVRKSVLAKMLEEILDTRVMIKDGMKTEKGSTAFQRTMNNRQLALKLIANVTYGYTSASYSGRMPCVEIADSIVSTGREILEKTIDTIGATKEWGAKVVYGDTDSIFVLLEGRSKEEALRIGKLIAEDITKRYPDPVKLKFEKVYLPSMMLTKKRYVGYMYEYPEQKIPVFDAKGIETVRRDGTPAEQKIEEKSLRILYETRDLSKVKRYLWDEWRKILVGDISIYDFCFAKEVRIGTYKSTGPLPPGAAISAKKMEQDERAEPQYRERVPYVVVSGPPNSRLVDRCVPPEEALRNNDATLDAEYYIRKNIIPPLERLFNILGANVRQWYDEMPKIVRYQTAGTGVRGETLRHYMRSALCAVCQKQQTSDEVCSSCREDAVKSVGTLTSKLRRQQRKVYDLESICRNCSGIIPTSDIKCVSRDCPVFYARVRSTAELEAVSTRNARILETFEF